MRDRQLFDEKTLKNGIRTFQYLDDTPYTQVILQVPVGSSNSTGSVTPGTFHFLEHILMLRSKRHPQAKEFNRLVGLKGGRFGASTSCFNTSYRLKIPSKNLRTVLPGFYSHIFEPVFNEQDIERERGVIANERRKKERWFPTDTEIGQYLRTQWQWDCPLSLRQRLGCDEDLARMTPQSLLEAHRSYFDPRVRVMVGGSGDVSALFDSLSTLAVSAQQPPQCFEPIHWVNQEYHERAFRDIRRFELHYAGIVVPRPEPLVVQALRFILIYLTNSIHGPLHEWLREEKGWVYEVGHSHDFDNKSLDWTLYFPLGNREQVNVVRAELEGRISAALDDEEKVDREVDRLGDHFDTFIYLRLEDILEDAQHCLESFGYIIPEVQLRKYLEKMRDVHFLQQVWREAFTPEQTGCFCAVPLED